MPAILAHLINVRSQLAIEVLNYLDTLAERMAELPRYYPSHLRKAAKKAEDATPPLPFDSIHQTVQIVADRTQYERWRAEERERLRSAGQEVDHLAYDPRSARPELEDDHDRPSNHPAPPSSIPWDEHAAQGFPRAIILGDPGFGKTWLLKYEARRIARAQAQRLRTHAVGLEELVFPIFERLSDLNNKDIDVETVLLNRVSKGHSTAFRQMVEKKLDSLHCVLLLDAWDEAGAATQKGSPSRTELRDKLHAFTEKYRRPRILLTSRIVGYDPSNPPLDEAQELELLAFDTPQVKAFVKGWFGATHQETANQFLSQINHNSQVRGLARVPLLLTLLCRLFNPDTPKPFPTRRVELYEQCLRGLLRDWQIDDKGKDAEDDQEVSEMHVECLLDLLADGGRELFEQGYEQFEAVVLAKTMNKWLKTEDYLGEFRDRTPTSLIAELKHSGVLTTVGDHRDAPLLFLHRTFHEYLTARALARQINHHGWDALVMTDKRHLTVQTFIDRRAWLPRWQEVIVLLAGQLDDPSLLFELLQDKETDDYFRHRLALAALCLPEAYPRLQIHHKTTIADQVTRDMILLWRSHRRTRCLDPTLLDLELAPHFTAALPALGQVNARIDSISLLDYLAQLLEDEEDAVRRVAAIAVRAIGSVAATPPILDCLARLLMDDDYQVKVAAKTAVYRMGSLAMTPRIVKILNSSLTEDHWDPLAIKFLTDGDSTAISSILQPLIDCLSNEDKLHRETTMRTIADLGSIAATLPMVEQLARLLASEDHEERYTAAWVVGSIGDTAATSLILERLTQLLMDKDANVRIEAAWAVKKIGGAAATAPILQNLMQLLTQDGEENVRLVQMATEAVGRLGKMAATPTLLTHLTRLLTQPDGAAQREALEALERLGGAETIAPLVPYLADLLVHSHRRVTWFAAKIVKDFGGPTVIVPLLDRLSELLGSDDKVVREHALFAVRQLGRVAATPPILNHLTRLLMSEDRDERHMAEWAVPEMGARAATVPILEYFTLQLMNEDEEHRVRESAAEVVGRLGSAAATAPIVELIMCLLTKEEDENLRQTAAWVARLSSKKIEADIFEYNRVAMSAFLENPIHLLSKKEGPRAALAKTINIWEAQGVRIFQEINGTWVTFTVKQLSQGMESDEKERNKGKKLRFSPFSHERLA